MQKNFDAVRIIANECKLLRPTKSQIRLSDTFLAPIREKLISDLVYIRRNIIDPRTRTHLLKMDTGGYEKYPVGYCLHIRDAIWDILRHNFREEPSSIPGLFLYQLNLRKIWCMDRLPSFQNAIQAGDYIIDAATDTFDPYKYPVKISKIEDAGLRNAADHADICATIESYWRVDCYPNIYFPQLAPFFPVIGVTQEGRVGFMCQNMRHMDAQNLIGGDFLSAKNFIFNSPFSHKRLLPKHLESLHWIPPIGRDSDRHAYQAMEKPKIQSVEKMFKHVHLYSPEILANVFLHHFSSMHNSALDIH